MAQGVTPDAPLRVVQAAAIAAPIASLAAGTAQGRVLAAFERSLYLDIDRDIVALVSEGLGLGPFTISLQDAVEFSTLPPGERAEAQAGRLRFGHIIVDLTSAQTWDPSLARAAEDVRACAVATTLVDRRRTVVELLVRGAPAESVARLLAPDEDHRASLNVALLDALGRGLSAIGDLFDGHLDPAEAQHVIAREVAGRGPGLTPSGDDVLVGIMHAITVWPWLAARIDGAVARSLLTAAARPRTTRISGAYLQAAARGHAGEVWHRLVRSLMRDEAALRASIGHLLRVGETSGADALTGFCWAWARSDHS